MANRKMCDIQMSIYQQKMNSIYDFTLRTSGSNKPLSTQLQL